MSQQLNLQILGLFTHPNVLSEAPVGALAVADNITIIRESIATTRRGFKQYHDPISSGSPNPIVESLFQYGDDLLAHAGGTLFYDNAGTWTAYTGTYEHPDGSHKIRTVEADKNFYFNGATGVQKIDDISLEPIAAGAPRGLGGTGITSGTTGWMATDTAVAYRIVWGYTDANNTLIIGTPSQRLVVTNTSGATRDVDLTFTIPQDVDENWLFFVYRSNESATALDIPDDELQLVYENNPTTAELTSLSLTFTDTTLNELKGAALYTNQSQQSILQTNDRPPYCKDMASYKDHIFYANTRTQHRYELSLISVGGTLGVVAGDTITIAGITYTGAAAENIAADEFLVDTAGTPSQNIDSTALSLLRVVNRSATTTNVYGYYLSGFEDTPGKMLFEERGVGGISFSLISSKETAWAPRLPVSGTAESSDNEDRPNRIYISKRQQPEAVPLTNWIDVGSANEPINRVVALRDSVMIFKDDGIFRLTGATLPFSVYPFNNSIEIRGLETAVVLDNRIFTMSDQGVVAIGDSGVEIISRSIEKDLIKLTADQFTNFQTVSFGLSYESERLYILSTVTEETDTTPTQMFVYNTITTSWTRWPIAYSAGIVKEDDDKIYLANPKNNTIYQERKSLTRRDFADDEFDVTITSAITSDVISVDDTTNLAPGMTLEQADTRSIILQIIDPSTVKVIDVLPWLAAGATAFTPIPCTLGWISQFAENPGITKHWRDATFMFDDASFREIDVTFSTNFITDIVYTLVPLDSGGGGFAAIQWGPPKWGVVPWGGAQLVSLGANIIRTLVPTDAQRSHWINVKLELNEAFAGFSVAGLSMMYNNVSNRIR